MECFVDTSAFYAYLVPGDRYHQPVREYLSEAVKAGHTLFSSSFVLGEILGLLQRRHGVPAAAHFMSDLYPAVVWRWLDEQAFRQVWRLVESENKRSFTAVDASAVVCIDERPGSVCVAVDADLMSFDFEVYPSLPAR